MSFQMRIGVFKFQVACFGFGAPTSNSRRFSMEHRYEITSVFALDLFFLQTKDRKTCFWGPKTRQLSKTPGNFRKRAGTFQKLPELPQNTRNFPKTPGTSQKHPELPRTSRELPKTPVELPNTRGTSQKHPGGGWWVVSHNTRGRSNWHGSGSDYHVAHVTRVNR